jgi:hypothetical protein
METNAKKSTIELAVKTISAKYNGNIIFQKKPVATTKDKWKFTIRTKDKLALPSRISAKGRPVYKCSWQAYGEIMEEIFRLDSGRVTDVNRTKNNPSGKQPLYIKSAIRNPLTEDGLFYEGFKWVDVDISMEEQGAPVMYSETVIDPTGQDMLMSE